VTPYEEFLLSGIRGLARLARALGEMELAESLEDTAQTYLNSISKRAERQARDGGLL
jgi:hypothetical protein